MMIVMMMVLIVLMMSMMIGMSIMVIMMIIIITIRYIIVGVQQLWHDICDYAMEDINKNSRQNSTKLLNKTTISNSISAAVLEHRFASFVRAGITNRNVILNRFKNIEHGITSQNKTNKGVTTSIVENTGRVTTSIVENTGREITSIVGNTGQEITSIVENAGEVTPDPISKDSRKVTWGKNRRSLKRREVRF